MELNEYQKRAMGTCMDTCDNFSYMALNLVAEVGEFVGKVAKQIRKENMEIGDNRLWFKFPETEAAYACDGELMSEAGDILWQLSGLCAVMGWDLEDIARLNLKKLASRQERGLIDGDGDNR